MIIREPFDPLIDGLIEGMENKLFHYQGQPIKSNSITIVSLIDSMNVYLTAKKKKEKYRQL